MVDTGGFTEREVEPIARSVRSQAQKALQEADVALLVLDARVGVTPDDEGLVDAVRRSGKPVLVVANKMDDSKVEARSEMSTLYALGFAQVFGISAAHGRGVADLLDAVVAYFPEALEDEWADPEVPKDEGIPRIAVVGRPNAGKSTLLNRLLEDDRLVVSEIPGTTRDAIEVELVKGGRKYRFIDTAGVRRKVGHGDDLEQETAGVAKDALQGADVGIVLFDATEPAVEQDARLLGECLKLSKPLVVAANKVDKLKGAAGRKVLRSAIEEHLKFLFSNAPIVELSGQRGTGLSNLLEVCQRVYDQSRLRIPTPKINKFLGGIEAEHPAPRHQGHPVRLYYMAQVGIQPPMFLIHCNRPEGITEAYRRFLENRMREEWGFEIPLRILFRKRKR